MPAVRAGCYRIVLTLCCPTSLFYVSSRDNVSQWHMETASTPCFISLLRCLIFEKTPSQEVTTVPSSVARELRLL